MKRLLYSLLVSFIVLTSFSYYEIPASAASAIITDDETSSNFVDYITKSLIDYSPTIDVTYYLGTERMTFSQLSSLWYSILKTDIRLYHVDSKLSYVYSTSGKKSNIIKDIRYNTPKAEYKKNLEAMKNEIKEITALAKPWMNDVEKALIVHDYLVLRYKYDNTLSKYSMKNLLVDKTAVCEGYASVFGYVMNELGIICKLIFSESINHIWNIIKIDGNWYHVDVTWDDPVPDTLGYVSHENFLMSDAEARKKGHTGWDKNMFQPAVSEQYSKAFWKNIYSEITVRPDFYYYTAVNVTNDNYFKSANVLRRNRSNGKVTSILSFKYNDLPKTSNFPLHLYNGALYFQTANGIYQMNMSGKNVKQILKQSGIRAMSMNENRISYTVSNGSSSFVNVKKSDSKNVLIDKTSIIIRKGLQAKIKASSSDNSYIYWESDDPSVVYCGNNGIIKGIATGKSVVRAYTENGTYAECKIEVKV